MSVGATTFSHWIRAVSWIGLFRGQDERSENSGAGAERLRCPGEFADGVFEGLLLRIAEWSAHAHESDLGTEVSTQYEYFGRGTLAGSAGGIAAHHGGSQTRRRDALPGGGQTGRRVLDRGRVARGSEASDRQLLPQRIVSVCEDSGLGLDHQGRIPG